MDRRKFIVGLLAAPFAALLPRKIFENTESIPKGAHLADELRLGNVTINEARKSIGMAPIEDVIQIEYIDHNGEKAVLVPVTVPRSTDESWLLKRYMREDIARIFRVPPDLLDSGWS